FFFFQAEDGIRDFHVTGVQTCALPISPATNALFFESCQSRRRDSRASCSALDSPQGCQFIATGGLLNVSGRMLCAPYKSSQYPMDKTRIQTLIVDRLQADLVIARDALKASHESATHAESKAENKYDTRGLEAAYLADGQRRRVHEIETALVAYRNLPVHTQEGEPIRVGALVSLDQEGVARLIFLGPDAAGLRITDEGHEVLVITPRSPLGQALLGRREGDEVEVLVDGRRQRCEVVTVW